MPVSRPVALITGAAHRIGKNIAETLHQRHLDIALHYNSSPDAAQQLCESLNRIRKNSCFTFQADLLQTEGLKTLVSQVYNRFSRIDYLVNNASIFYPTPIDKLIHHNEISLKQFMNINFLAPMRLIKLTLPYLRKNRGAILNIVDIYARTGLEKHVEYVASKEALLCATRSFAEELAPEVRVNGISPGAILWPESNCHVDAKGCLNTQKKILEKTALNRKGTPSDIGMTAAYLLLDASYTTGCTIAVDGGRQLYI